MFPTWDFFLCVLCNFQEYWKKFTPVPADGCPLTLKLYLWNLMNSKSSDKKTPRMFSVSRTGTERSESLASISVKIDAKLHAWSSLTLTSWFWNAMLASPLWYRRPACWGGSPVFENDLWPALSRQKKSINRKLWRSPSVPVKTCYICLTAVG